MKASGLIALCTFVLFFLLQSCSRSGDNVLNPPPPPSQDSIPQTPNDPGTPAAIDSAVTIYSCTDKDSLHAFNAWDGSKKWSIKIPDLYASPTYADGMLYLSCLNNKLVAVDTTGKVQWTKTLERDISLHHAVVGNGLIYINDEGANIYALDIASGNIKWQFKTEQYTSGNVVLKDGVIYCNAWRLYAIDALTGQIIWTANSSGFVQPLVTSNKVYANGADKYNADIDLKVFDRTTGALLQQIEVGSIIGLNAGNGYVYCVTEGLEHYFVHAFDTANLEEKWIVSTPKFYPTFADSVFIVNSFEGISFYDAHSGKLTWHWPSHPYKMKYINNVFYLTAKLNTFWDSYVIAARDRATNTVKWKSIPLNGSSNGGFCVVTKSGRMF